jgi:hypothetical protein
MSHVATLFVRSLVVVAMLAAGCSRSEAAPAGTSSAVSAGTVTVASASAASGKTFGSACVEDAECAGAICFHKRLKTGQALGPEHRGGNDPVEHDGYCSMRCDDDGQCPVPPTSGRCGARGMCKRPE